MSALNDFIVAAASYFGLPDSRVTEGSTIDDRDGEMGLILRIALTPDEVVGIGKRMGVLLSEKAVDDAQRAKVGVEVHLPSNVELRAAWTALTRAERSAYGSFGVFKVKWNAAEEDVGKAEVPPHVYVPGLELTEQQKMLSVGYDTTTGKYAMDPADLTPEQIAEHFGVKS